MSGAALALREASTGSGRKQPRYSPKWRRTDIYEDVSTSCSTVSPSAIPSSSSLVVDGPFSPGSTLAFPIAPIASSSNSALRVPGAASIPSFSTDASPTSSPKVSPSYGYGQNAPIASLSSPSAAEATTGSPVSSSSTTFSLTLFPPGYPTPAPHSSASDEIPLSSTGSARPTNTGSDSSPSGNVPIPSAAPFSGAGRPSGGSLADQDPSNTISLTAFLPTDSATVTGANGAVTPVSATSGALSRTFAHNTGAIVGVAIGTIVALVLGALLLLDVDITSPTPHRRRRRPTGRLLPRRAARFATGKRQRFPPPPLLPVTPGPRPSPPRRPSPTPASARADADSPTLPAFSPPPPEEDVEQKAEGAASPIGAKGFMRRLRRGHGRPSLASRGLLTTLAPVPESPAPSMAEVSRPPSSLQGLVHAPASVSRPAPAPLPWIHRTRAPGSAAGEASDWTPPVTWSAPVVL
ncbi:hypothetical protein C8R46DRAFT_1346364 [Mycena filopes]|nr:hypothetical protein C8R46DRAFT_1346364 [Mycena filopes]